MCDVTGEVAVHTGLNEARGLLINDALLCRLLIIALYPIYHGLGNKITTLCTCDRDVSDARNGQKRRAGDVSVYDGNNARRTSGASAKAHGMISPQTLAREQFNGSRFS